MLFYDNACCLQLGKLCNAPKLHTQAAATAACQK